MVNETISDSSSLTSGQILKVLSHVFLHSKWPPRGAQVGGPTQVGGPKPGMWVGPSWAQVGGPTLGPNGWAHARPKWVGPSRAQVGGPKLGPRGWARAGPKWMGPRRAQVGGPKPGPKWVGPGYTDLAPLGLRSKNKVFELSG